MSNIFIPLDDLLSSEGDIVSKELMQALADDISYLLDSMPVGSIVPVLVGFPGVPTPNPLLWQECDGATVANDNSPIRNQPTTDMHSTQRFPRGAPNPGVAGNVGGTLSRNLHHDHGGVTGIGGNDTLWIQDELHGTEWTSLNHLHTISADLSTYDIQPAHLRIKMYLKIL